jgi:hypothetical protein
MTKLAPIELLAREYINAMGYAIMDNSELEQLRQAIIKDFVSKAEVKAALIDDPLHLNGITKDDAAINYYSKRGKATKLYALPDWIEK